MITKKAFFILAAPLLLLTTGCATNLQGDSYSREDARQVQTVEFGTLEDVRLVAIEGTKTPIGTLAGAAIGGIVGNSVGGGKGSQVAAVIGAVAGSLAGAAAEEGLTKSQGVELVIRLHNSNKIISLVQGHNPDRPFYTGDRVRLMTINGQIRVAR
jgi:outer membrane lipoprotein SlyB|tara:strand:- start:331 stop:798 length:468 start_codon:yes stop_codon:yes gene_type:complete